MNSKSEHEPVDRSVRHQNEWHHRIFRWALVLSVLFHIAVVLWFRADVLIPPSPFAAAGPRSGDARAAAGGGSELVALRVAQEQVEQPTPVVVEEVTPIPEPEPDVEVVEPEPQVSTVAAAATVQAIAGIGEGKGATTGAGIEGGTGEGDGGNAEEGLFRLVPPSPRSLILPPSNRPGKLRGREVDVWVFVNARGQVVGDSTRIVPTTGDRKFDNRLREQAGEWVFEPARKAGQAIAEWYRYTIVL